MRKIENKQVETIEQYHILQYLLKEFCLEKVNLYIVNRNTICLKDKNNDEMFFEYDTENKKVFYYDAEKPKEL